MTRSTTRVGSTLLLSALAAFSAGAQDLASARVVNQRTLIISSSTTTAVGDVCLQLRTHLAGDILLAVEPLVFAVEGGGVCGNRQLWTSSLYLRPDSLHSRLAIGPVALGATNAWIELELTAARRSDADLSIRIWSKPYSRAALERQRQLESQVHLIVSQYDNEPAERVVQVVEVGLLVYALFEVTHGEGLSLMFIKKLIAEKTLMFLIKRSVSQKWPDRFYVVDDSCGARTEVHFRDSNETTYSGPSGCFQGILIRRQ